MVNALYPSVGGWECYNLKLDNTAINVSFKHIFSKKIFSEYVYVYKIISAGRIIICCLTQFR
jgi:hypothetical protein